MSGSNALNNGGVKKPGAKYIVTTGGPSGRVGCLFMFV